MELAINSMNLFSNIAKEEREEKFRLVKDHELMELEARLDRLQTNARKCLSIVRKMMGYGKPRPQKTLKTFGVLNELEKRQGHHVKQRV